MKLREDWNNFTKFISIRAVALAAALQVAWPMIPDDMKSHLPEGFVKWVTIGLLVVVTYGVMIKQGLQK